MALDLIAEPQASVRMVEAELMFTVPTAEKPYGYGGDPPPGVSPYHGEYRQRTVRVEDARPIAGRLRLDVEGVALVRHASAVRDFRDEAQVLALGHPEAAQLVREATGASRVVVFDHTVRRRSDKAAEGAGGVTRPPSTRLHVDQTIWSGPKRVREIMGDAADALLAGRAAIVNVWRPIVWPARDQPLVLGDARSFAAEDLVPTDLIFAHRRGETYGVAYNPAQRWLYVPDVQPDEALLIKCWDSDARVARFAPHSSFADPSAPPGTPPRQSIEFRTIAFFDQER